MYRNSVNFMKITTEFTNFGCEVCLFSRSNNNNSHLTAFFQDNPVGQYQKDKTFWIIMKQRWHAISWPYASHLRLTADR